MRISGNPTAIKEILHLLDPKFSYKLLCRWCHLEDESFRQTFHEYLVEYDGENFGKIVNLNQAHYASDGSNNILCGCVA